MAGRWVAALFGVVLAGCAATGGDLTHSERYPAYTGSVMRYAAGGRDLVVDIRGNPTAAPEAEFGGAVLRAMQATYGGDTRFTATPDNRARLNFRVILLFGAPADSNGRALCAGDPVGAAPPGNRLRLQAAFCQRHTVLSEVVGEASAIAGSADPALTRLVERVTLALLPTERPGEPQGSGGYILDRLIFGN
ncbi:MAG: hypothetical protein EXQ87_07850 [Alphaproteobacteria bacterium]|nr:hypothetical protein [Alphaproteobacteria bacterium]